MNMTGGNTLFKKRESHLVTYEFCPSKTQADYCLVKIDQKNFLKAMKVNLSGECMIQLRHWYVNLRSGKRKNPEENLHPGQKIWSFMKKV